MLRPIILMAVGVGTSYVVAEAIEPIMDKLHQDAKEYELHTRLASVGRFIIASAVCGAVASYVIQETAIILDLLHIEE